MATTVVLGAERVAAKATTPAATANVPTTGMSTKNSRVALWAVLLAFGLVAVAWWLAVNAVHDKGFKVDAPLPPPLEGLTIFAVFFVAAQAIERLLEPITKFFGIGAEDTFAQNFEAAKKAVLAALDAASLAENLPAGAASDELTKAKAKADTTAKAAKEALDEAATSKAVAAEVKGNRAVIFWAIASGIAVLSASALKLYLLRTTGIAQPSRALDLLATGLILGAGTKPLHDLITNIEKKKEAAAAAAGSDAATAPTS